MSNAIARNETPNLEIEMNTTETVYVIREANGSDYYSESDGFVPCSDRATEYTTREEAGSSVEENCQTRDVKIFSREID